MRIYDVQLRAKLRTATQTIEDINEELERKNEQLGKYKAAKTQLDSLRARLAELEELADEVYEISPTEALVDQLRREAQQLETDRIEHRTGIYGVFRQESS